MSQPLPKPIRVRSEYQDGKRPAFVDKWEKWANEAPDDMAALIQLAYFQALQIRTIKLILAWTLIVLPIIFAVGFFVLNQAISERGHL